jgi:hypothetical protein
MDDFRWFAHPVWRDAVIDKHFVVTYNSIAIQPLH